MNEKKVINRWWVVLGAVTIQLSLGAIYAWSVFTKPLADAGWSKTETQIIFSAGLAFFALSTIFSGRLLPRFGPRILSIAGGVLLGLGYILGGIVNAYSFPLVLLFIGILGGIGIGLVYVIPIAVGMRWFPDKKGMITGLAVAGFGFGALLWVKLAGNWGNLIENVGLGNTFLIYGIIFLVSIVLGGMIMIFPPDDWKPEGYKEDNTKNKMALKAEVNFTPKEMLKTSQFYLIWITLLFGSSAGLMCIGLMKLFPMEALMAQGISEFEAAGIAGTAMAVFFSLANGIGRIVWGMISDRIGRKKSIMIMTALQGVIVICFQWIAGIPILLYLGATLIGFNFGGNFALFPTITAEIFGSKSVGQNYGYILMAYGIGGIFGPIMGGYLGDMKNFPLAFTICGVLCLFAATLISQVKPVEKKSEVLATATT